MATNLQAETLSLNNTVQQNRRIERTSDGTLWLWGVDVAGTKFLECLPSKNEGVSFPSAFVILNKVVEATVFCDEDDAFHILFKTDTVADTGLTGDSIYYVRGVPDAAFTNLTLGTPTLLLTHTEAHVGDVVACRRPGSSPVTWDAFVAYYKLHNTGGDFANYGDTTYYRRIPIANDGTLGTPTNDGRADRANIDTNGGGPYITLDFHHTGNGKSVKDDAPHVFMSYSSGPNNATFYPTNTDPGTYFRKATYSAGSWTWGAELLLDANHWPDSGQWMNTLFDGEHIYVVGSCQDTTQNSYDLILWEVALDGLSSTRYMLIEDANGASHPFSMDPMYYTFTGSATYDDDGNVYCYVVDANEDIRLWKWDRVTGLLETVRVVDTPTTTSDSLFPSAVRGWARGNAIEAVWNRGFTTPYDVAYDKTIAFRAIDNLFAPTDIAYDYAIGGLPFLSALSEGAPLRRATAPYRKEQTDQSTEVGEQSLSFWWLRSQSSFHGGAGQSFLDGGDTDPYRKIRFDYSRGVDVWTEGEVGLLHAMAAPATTEAIWAVVPSALGGVFYTGNNPVHVNSSGTKTTLTGHTGTVQGPLATDGEWIYYTTTDGLWRHSALSASGTSTQMYGSTTNVLQHLVFAKERLFGIYNNKLYELSLTATGTTALPAAKYTHANASAVIQTLAEGPDGLYLAVKTRTRGDLYFMSLTDVSGVPTLGAAIQVMQLPDGEAWWDSPWCLGTYLGKFLLIATGSGIRIAKISAGGVVDLGPQTISEHPDGDFVFGGFATDDRFVYAVAKGVSPGQTGTYLSEVCAFRIDLSMEIAEGRYAWAQDVATGDTGLSPKSCCFGGEGVLYVAGDSSAVTGLYKVTNTYAQDAYLMTSRIRYSTGEDKVFERLQLAGEGTAGSISAVPYLNGATGSNVPSVALAGNQLVSAEERIDDQFAGKQTTHIQVKLVFSPAGTYVQQGQMKLRGYVLKALPAQKRQRTEQIPVLIYDMEKDRTGQTRGGEGTGYPRLTALEALEETGEVVTLQRFGPYFSEADDRLVVIDRVEFQMTGKPTDRGSGWGGIALITVRMVD